MAMLISQLILLIFIIRSFSQQLYYVKPNASTPCPPQVPYCLTIDEYAENWTIYHHSGCFFHFLPGTHQTDRIVSFKNISTVSLVGHESTIIDFVVNCEYVFNLTIEKMAVTFVNDNRLTESVFTFNNSKGVTVSNVRFEKEISLHSNFSNRAISFNHSNATIKHCTFIGNAAIAGAAVRMFNGSNVIFIGNAFIGNTANLLGGAIFSYQSSMQFLAWNIFINNSASEAGSIHCQECKITGLAKLEFIGGTAMHCGGAICLNRSTAVFHNITAAGNSKSSIVIYNSEVTFEGHTIIKGNIGDSGGGIVAMASVVSFHTYTLFEMNLASIEGGAIAAIGTATLYFTGTTYFINNVCGQSGGGAILTTVHVVLVMGGTMHFNGNNSTSGSGGAISLTKNSRMIINNTISFSHNRAVMGGALYVMESHVVLRPNSIIITKYNHATSYGGAMFHYDSIDFLQCSFFMHKHSEMTFQYMYSIFILLPDCFLQLDNFEHNSGANSYHIHSINDTAGVSGHFLYGGLLDKCRLYDYNGGYIWANFMYYMLFKNRILQIQNFEPHYLISSEAFTLCFCENDKSYDCFENKTISTLRGAEFQVSVAALSQGFTMTSPMILAKVSKTARLGLNQNSRNISAGCTSVSYNMYSTQDQETLVLYPDQSCRDRGLAAAEVIVSFESCPHGSVLSKDKCDCEKRLLQYDNAITCTVTDEGKFLITKENVKFWVQAFFNQSNNNQYQGLILYNSCPLDYCKNTQLNISLKEPDLQCDFNHTGILCGGCANNYSLIFGNTKCRLCSDVNLYLVALFAAMGIFLVFVISALRLTVATGMVNSLILYANIIQANKSVFLPNAGDNILTVFIAWMNLDFGFPTCFYDGMDAYAQTWLQFVFPVYIWFLICVIIITSRYSRLMTRIIGSNPVAVLATLLLMSYAKLLKTIIQIFSFVTLSYPNHIAVNVWLKDANEPYLKGRHLLLAIFGSVFIAVFFFPYTFFLLFSTRLYKYSGKAWSNRIILKMKPLLDSYHAPYQKHTRYWTGILLVLHCILYTVFSFNGIGEMSNSLLAIITGYTAVIVAAWLHVKIYTSFYVNVLEALVYLDLIVLSAATASNDNHPALVYTLIGFVFMATISIIVYQFHCLYISKLKAWRKMELFLFKLNLFKRYGKKKENVVDNDQTPLTNPTSPRIVTKTELSFRESLIEDYGATKTN